ncbi:hypothetical protein PHJA_002443900 [Phtheirospermum japonicum]|uniref:Uncharacterized protein n=1 Tax=Phtheirospermum japonicum TaxID=374723 RepID=A0A830CSZ2_9LAMI|nr:hypothetical protein PHJA_002443900 [Phtheirospermum japonicum]
MESTAHFLGGGGGLVAMRSRLAPFLGFHWRLLMEDYRSLKLKRKDLEDVNDDFSDFSLCSPARKIRRLDADLPPIIEDEECEIPMAFEHSLLQEHRPGSCSSGGIRIEELPDVPINDEKAIVLFNPSTLPRSPSNFSVSVDPRLISALKNKAPWSDQSNTWRLADDDEAEEKNNCLAVVPWVPSQLPAEAGAELPSQFDNSEMMDAQEVEEEEMDVEDGDIVQTGGMMLNEGYHQWQQQHCLIPQPPHNATAPIVWYQ